jgi:hypothetical protein
MPPGASDDLSRGAAATVPDLRAGRLLMAIPARIAAPPAI